MEFPEVVVNARLEHDIRLLGQRYGDDDDVSILLVCQSPGARARLSAGLYEILPSNFELLEVPTCERALKLAQVARPDVLIVDSRQGQRPDTDFISRLGYRVAVIFLVDDPADGQYAFDAGAIDCVMAPVKPERLERALQRAMTWTTLNRATPLEAPLWDAGDGGRGLAQWLRIARGQELLVVRPEDVLYLQASRKLTRVVLKDTDGVIRTGINSVFARLDPAQFWRIHRSMIVNARHVEAVRQDELGRAVVRLRGRAEQLHASRVHERRLLQDGIS